MADPLTVRVEALLARLSDATAAADANPYVRVPLLEHAQALLEELNAGENVSLTSVAAAADLLEADIESIAEPFETHLRAHADELRGAAVAAHEERALSEQQLDLTHEHIATALKEWETERDDDAAYEALTAVAAVLEQLMTEGRLHRDLKRSVALNR